MSRPKLPDPNYVSPIVKQRMAEIKASNAKLAGGPNYVIPLVKLNDPIPVHNSGAGRPNFPVDPTSPRNFSPPQHDLINHAPGLDRGWHAGGSRRTDPNFSPGWFTPLVRKA